MTMLRGTNLSAGSGTAQLGAAGGLLPNVANVANVAAFARAHGKQVASSHQSLPVSSLISIHRRGPAIICGWGRDVRQPDRSLSPSFGHASVLSGNWSSNDPDGLTTMFRVHDPWPPNRGAIWFDFYHDRPGRPVGYARFGDVFIQCIAWFCTAHHIAPVRLAGAASCIIANCSGHALLSKMGVSWCLLRW